MRTIGTKNWILRILTVAVVACLAISAGAQDTGGSASGASSPGEPQVTQPSQGGVNWKGVGIGAGTVVTNLAYIPAKLAYGILGGIGGGLGYALTGGNKQVADSIWRSSLGGDYVLTPDMMTGKQPIYFSGPSETGPSSAPSNGIPAAPSASLSSPKTGTDTAPTTRPIDNGAGPVGATNGPRPTPYAGVDNPGGGYGAYNPPPTLKGSARPDTSVE
jgi:hypothetical protein